MSESSSDDDGERRRARQPLRSLYYKIKQGYIFSQKIVFLTKIKYLVHEVVLYFFQKFKKLYPSPPAPGGGGSKMENMYP